MQSGTLAVATVAEAVIDAEVVVTATGQTVNLHTREDSPSGTGVVLGTLTLTNSPLYLQMIGTGAFIPLVLPIDWVA